MQSPRQTKARRNLRALFALGFTLAFVASTGGGLILALGYSHPSVAQPMWKFGRLTMLLGLYNLFVYLCIFFQVRSLTIEIKEVIGNKQV